MTPIDIKYIEQKITHLAFKLGALGIVSNNHLDPCFISNSGLIFIYGNSFFGVTHITERHGWHTDGSEWRSDNAGRSFLDNPSKFDKSLIPVDDYRRIADEIYKKQNRRESKNENLFEKYSGSSMYSGRLMDFHLIIYRIRKLFTLSFISLKRLTGLREMWLILKKPNLK